MVIAALLSFIALLAAWMAAPDRPTHRPATQEGAPADAVPVTA